MAASNEYNCAHSDPPKIERDVPFKSSDNKFGYIQKKIFPPKAAGGFFNRVKEILIVGTLTKVKLSFIGSL